MQQAGPHGHTAPRLQPNTYQQAHSEQEFAPPSPSAQPSRIDDSDADLVNGSHANGRPLGDLIGDERHLTTDGGGQFASDAEAQNALQSGEFELD